MAAWFLWQTMQKDGGANIAMASRFSLAAYIICLFDPLLSLVYFRQFLHFTYIYVALVTQGLLCYNIATLVSVHLMSYCLVS